MSVLRRETIAAACLLAVVMLGGCANGVKVGNFYLIKPTEPAPASSVEVVRNHPQDPEQYQKLTVHLDDGRASLLDYDGKTYPLQIDGTRREEIREFVTAPAWYGSTYRAERDADEVVTYQLEVYHRGEPIKRQVAWSVPSRKPLPEELLTIIDTFEHADRYAHPLSNRVDLLE